MTTARARYEAKTKVVSFRVGLDLYQDLDKIKADNRLSYADLIKLGAGITKDQVQAKLNAASDLETKLAALELSVRDKKQALSHFELKEKRKIMDKLEAEARIFRLFDLGWSLEEVGFDLGISQAETYEHFKEWGKIRKQKQKVQLELLKKCLRKHINTLEDHLYWSSLHGRNGKDVEEARSQLEHCRHLLIDPSRLQKRRKVLPPRRIFI